MKKLLVGFALFGFAIALLSFGEQVNGGLIASDNASASVYDNGWQTTDNGGSGFGAWTLANGGGNSGHFIGNSTSLGSPGADINVSNESFGMFGHSGQTSTADRSFSSALVVGDTFTINLAVNFRNGNKGFNLYNSLNSEIFNFNIGSNDYRVNNAATGNGSIGASYSGNTAFNLTFVQTSLSGGTWQITRSGGVSDSDSGTYSGIATRFRLYNSSTDNGSNENNLFANSMSITAVPEPTALLMVGLVGMAGLVRRRR